MEGAIESGHLMTTVVFTMNGRKVLYNSKCLDVFSLLVKYYVPLAHFNKVIKLLSVNLQ